MIDHTILPLLRQLSRWLDIAITRAIVTSARRQVPAEWEASGDAHTVHVMVGDVRVEAAHYSQGWMATARYVRADAYDSWNGRVRPTLRETLATLLDFDDERRIYAEVAAVIRSLGVSS